MMGLVVVIVAIGGTAYFASEPSPPPRPPRRSSGAAQLAALASALAAPLPSSSAALDDELPPAPEIPPPRPLASAPPKPSARTGPTPLPVLPPAKDSESELKLLQRAQDALVTTPDVALALADEDVRRFPGGILRQEAEVIAIQALARMGKPAAAEARAMRFREAYPRSTHLRRIEAVLGHEDER
jgi:hypothetical protein